MAVSAPLVFKQAAAEGALERQLVAVDLLVTLQVAQAAEEDQRRRMRNSYSQRLIINMISLLFEWHFKARHPR